MVGREGCPGAGLGVAAGRCVVSSWGPPGVDLYRTSSALSPGTLALTLPISGLPVVGLGQEFESWAVVCGDWLVTAPGAL